MGEQEEQQDATIATANGDGSRSADGSTSAANDEDDRRTIRASVSAADVAESKTAVRANGHINGNGGIAGTVLNGHQQQSAVEKTAGDVRAQAAVDVSGG